MPCKMLILAKNRGICRIIWAIEDNYWLYMPNNRNLQSEGVYNMPKTAEKTSQNTENALCIEHLKKEAPYGNQIIRALYL